MVSMSWPCGVVVSAPRPKVSVKTFEMLWIENGVSLTLPLRRSRQQ
jgi:hypothetical protein